MSAAVAAVADEATETEKAQLELPGFEGHKVTEMRLNFSGNILVTEGDVADSLGLDGEVELIVKGRVVSSNHGARRDAGGTKVTNSRAVYVESVELAD